MTTRVSRPVGIQAGDPWSQLPLFNPHNNGIQLFSQLVMQAERDVLAVLVDLYAVPVKLHLVAPHGVDRRLLTERRRHWDDKAGFGQHART